jgi:hypothetical protein
VLATLRHDLKAHLLCFARRASLCTGACFSWVLQFKLPPPHHVRTYYHVTMCHVS